MGGEAKNSDRAQRLGVLNMFGKAVQQASLSAVMYTHVPCKLYLEFRKVRDSRKLK